MSFDAASVSSGARSNHGSGSGLGMLRSRAGATDAAGENVFTADGIPVFYRPKHTDLAIQIVWKTDKAESRREIVCLRRTGVFHVGGNKRKRGCSGRSGVAMDIWYLEGCRQRTDQQLVKSTRAFRRHHGYWSSYK